MEQSKRPHASILNNKKVLIIAAIVIALLIVLVFNICRQIEIRNYHATYLIIDETEYRRDITSLDLSGKAVSELHKLKELHNLQHLDLQHTGVTYQQVTDLQAALPGCQILWSVPFQGGHLINTTEELVLKQLDEADFSDLQYFPNLSSVNADDCTDYDALVALVAQYPHLSVSYRVTVGGENYGNLTEELTVTDPDVDELLDKLPLLPKVSTVYLEGNLPENSRIVALKEQFPNVTFVWDFQVLGIDVNSLTTFLDLSRIVIKDTAELESMLPCFYQLEQIDMIDCGIKDADMEALNQRHPDTKFVWRVNVNGVWVRTDAKFFMPYKHGMKKIAHLTNLKYCHDMVCIDLGHFGVWDFEFVEHMPNLRFLLLLDCEVYDLSSIAACTSIEFLEIAQTPLRDYWLLTNMTNLKNLNISATPYSQTTHCCIGMNDNTPLYQMTFLDRLWYARNYMDEEQCTLIREAMPDTVVTLKTGGCTTCGWRYSPDYYEHRDILSMWYMVH